MRSGVSTGEIHFLERWLFAAGQVALARYAVERDAVVGSAVGEVKGVDGFEPVIFGVDEPDLCNLDFPAVLRAKSHWVAMSQNAAREGGVYFDWLM